MRVIDLDVLRPEKVIVKLGGYEVDCSIMPLGLTFDIDALIRRSVALDSALIKANDQDETRKAFDITVEMCVLFASHQHPEMTREWFNLNASVGDVQALGSEIRDALERAYKGIDPKN